MFNLARKNHLAMNLNKLRKAFPDSYGFFPKTWILPADKGDLVAQFKDRKPKTFILKPQASCQGRGILLIQYPEQIPDGEPMVAQKYVLKPYLLDGLKFDLRLYFLVASSDPLRLYIFKEGMARLATNQYQAPSRSNLQNMFMHLTNYAINKQNDEFKQNDGNDNETGHKRLMSWVFEHMKANGVDTDRLWLDIKRLALKTLCVAQPQIAHHYRSGQSEDYFSHMCFEVLGFDVMIDAQARPILIEVNHTPSFSTDSQLDHDLKSKVIHDAVQIMNLTPKMKTQLIKQKKREAEQRVVTGKRVKLTPEEREKEKQRCMALRDKYIRKHIGGYEQIYPIPEGEPCNEPYEEFMKIAQREFEIQTGAVKRPPKKEDVLTKPAFGTRIPVGQASNPKQTSSNAPPAKPLGRSGEFNGGSLQKPANPGPAKPPAQAPSLHHSSLQTHSTSASSVAQKAVRPSSSTKDGIASLKNASASEEQAFAARLNQQGMLKNDAPNFRISDTRPGQPLERRPEQPQPDPKHQAMKQEIASRVEQQQEAKRQLALKVQMQRGLHQPDPNPRRYVAARSDTFSDPLPESPQLNRPPVRPHSNDRAHHSAVAGYYSLNANQSRALEPAPPSLQAFPDASSGNLRFKKNQLAGLPIYLPENKLVPFDQNAQKPQNQRQAAKKFPAIHQKVELVLKPNVITFGPGLCVAGYHNPSKPSK